MSACVLFCGLSGGVEHRFLVEGFFAFEFYAGAFEKCFDHLSDAFLHFGADGAFADQDREAMEIFRVLAA